MNNGNKVTKVDLIENNRNPPDVKPKHSSFEPTKDDSVSPSPKKILIKKTKRTISNIPHNLVDFFFHKILLFKKKHFHDFKIKIFFFMISMILTLFVVLAGLIIPVYSDFSMSILWKVILNTIIALSFLILVISFFFFRNSKLGFTIFLFIFSLFCNGIALYFIITTDKHGPFSHPLYFLFYVIPYFNIFLEGYSLFWICVLIIINITGLIIDIIFNFDLPDVITMKEKRISSIIQYYVVLGFCSYFGIVSFYIVRRAFSRERSMLKVLTNSIIKLNFDEKDVTKLLNEKVNKNEVISSMRRIVLNMKSYKSYLPNFEDMYQNFETSSSDSSSKNAKSSDDLSEPVSLTSTSTEKTSNTSSTVDSNGSKNLKLKRRVKKDELNNYERMKGLYVFQRAVVIMQVTLRINMNLDIFKSPNAQNVSSMLIQDIFKEFIDLVLSVVSKTRGSISNIWNNHVLISWNAEKISVSSIDKACNAAIKICQKWRKNGKNYKIAKIGVGIITNSRGFCGNYGVAGWRRFNIFVGDEMDRLDKLKEYCSIEGNNNKGILGGFGGFSQIVVEGKDVYDKLKYNFNIKQIDYVRKYGNDVYEIVSVKKERRNDANEEWMYSISSDLEENEVEKAFQKAWEMYKEKKYESVLRALEKIEGSYDEKYVNILRKKVLMEMEMVKKI